MQKYIDNPPFSCRSSILLCQRIGGRIYAAVALCCLLALLPAVSQAQPQARRQQQQQVQQQKSNADNLTNRARISFPTSNAMSEDVVWRRDIYREIDLTQDANAALYYPAEPVGTQMNLFTFIFKQMMRGQIKAYEYRLDGNEVFNDSARIKPLAFLDNYHIFYERVNGRVRLDDSDIPSKEVRSYYIKESAYYDQANSTFHTKVVALCPIMSREDDFGDGTAKYPLFWVQYEDIAPFLSKQTIMTSDKNNAATMSVEDYFTKNMYRGKIYKTTNMLGRTLAQYCNTDSALTVEQQRIEQELLDFEKHVWGDTAERDSLDSIANLKADTKKVKKTKRSRRGGSDAEVDNGDTAGKEPAKKEAPEPKVRAKRSARPSSSSSSSRMSVRRQRH